MNKKNLNDVLNISKKILRLLYIILFVVGIYIILKIIKELKVMDFFISILKILAPLFIGIVVAWLLNPFIKWLEKKGMRRGFGVTISYILLVGFIFVIMKSLIPLLYNQTIDLVENIPSIFDGVESAASNVLDKLDSSSIDIESIQETMSLRLDEYAKSLSTTLPSAIINIFTSTIYSVGTFVIGLVIGFFLLLGCNNLGNTLLDIVPKKFRKSTNELGKAINESLRNYVAGAAIDAFIVFAISTIAFAIIGLKAPLLFGLFCGLMNVIPYAGPYIGGAPAVIVGFSQGPGIGLAILIAIAVIQTIEGNVLQALIMSKTTKLNPVTIIIGLLIFGHFFGMLGMLLSTPIIGVSKVIIKYFDDKYDFLNFNQEEGSK